MRIVIVSAPRSGNHWIECLLGTIYELHRMGGRDKPEATRPQAVRQWLRNGGFPDGSHFHLHCRFSRKVCNIFEAVPAHLVTVVRDPYDVFVSYYYWTQQRVLMHREHGARRPRHRMVGRPLDDPEVLAFLADPKGFRTNLTTANSWLHSGRAIVVRYEDLHQCPIEALTRVTDQIAPVEPDRIVAAIEACRAENMRQKSAMMAWNVRVAKVGDSRERLSEAHLAIFRENHADLIRSLGYEVR
jgi:hypothetical protein